MNYKISPGIYAVGNADQNAPVFVSANYKLSFDILRRELDGLDAWVLVLDTKGINVWCAAGKGTFGTEGLIKQILEVKLNSIVTHRQIIVPQLGASKMQAHVVTKETGFSVKYGPIYARDIKQYLNNGNKATKKMRSVQFNLLDRMVLTPMEITLILKYIGIYMLVIFFIFGLQPEEILFKEALVKGYLFVILGIVTILMGAYVTPIFLPYIPSRSFALKGLLSGLVPVVAVRYLFPDSILTNPSLTIGSFLFFPTISSYLALNFTGCSTFTSLSGVVREMKIAVPFYIIALAGTIISLIYYKLVLWGIV